MAIFTFLHWDEETAKKILLIEEEIDNMEKTLRLNHIKDLMKEHVILVQVLFFWIC